jgi:CubicO group peptidase (beta-lactamase class C family)
MKELSHRLQGLLKTLASKKGVHHVVLGITSGDGSVEWSGALGDATPDGRPMHTDTPYFVASIDKLFTATVILKLSERGEIGLDESMVTYLPTSLIGECRATASRPREPNPAPGPPESRRPPGKDPRRLGA